MGKERGEGEKIEEKNVPNIIQVLFWAEGGGKGLVAKKKQQDKSIQIIIISSFTPPPN